MPLTHYIVAEGNAYAIDEEGYMFGAPVFKDNTVDWEHSYEFEPDEEDAEYDKGAAAEDTDVASSRSIS